MTYAISSFDSNGAVITQFFAPRIWSYVPGPSNDAVFEELNFIKGGVLGIEFLPVCSFLSRIIRHVWAIDENKGQLCLDYRLINVDISGGAES